jgi:LacI family transcriptional regulator
MWPDDASVRILVHLDQAIGFHRDAFAGIAQAVQGYDRVLLDLNWANLPLKAAIERQRPVGIIAAVTREAEIKFIEESAIPAINIANVLSAHSRIPVVGNDDLAVGRLSAQFFLDRGYECFGYACAEDVEYFRPRKDSFMRAITEAGFSCEMMPVIDPVERSVAGSTQWIARWLHRFEKPLAVMCPFDPDARDVAEAARLAGIRVPEQVSIMGVDNDLNLCMTTLPTLSSVATAASKIGRVALQQVLRLIEGHPAPTHPILIPPTGIIERGSTGEVAVEDADVAKAIHFMRNNLSERINVSFIAERTATSRRTLERKFLQAIGRTPLQELRRLRIERAKRLLLSTDLELKEVARSSGLIHVQRLAKLVKEDTGLSPAKLRRTRTESANPSG